MRVRGRDDGGRAGSGSRAWARTAVPIASIMALPGTAVTAALTHGLEQRSARHRLPSGSAASPYAGTGLNDDEDAAAARSWTGGSGPPLTGAFTLRRKELDASVHVSQAD
ncbi:hypothetical protein [Streptosporangium sp. NPDC002524]|uniref:hypothetical protein n=1 Tax=Streptosporangium sp. NPDC002524 TaxID=3154537 RepID=UPI00331917AC